MEFATDELTLEVGRTAREFAAQHIKPYVMEWDESQTFPNEVFSALGRLGMMGVVVPEEYGGSGLSYLEYVTIIREISAVCGAVGLSLAAHNSLCTGHILSFGSEEQKKKYLPRLASGEAIGEWGLTGPKNWITHGISGDIAVVVTRTGEPRAKNNATVFIVERGTPGFSGGKKKKKLEIRSSEKAGMI